MTEKLDTKKAVFSGLKVVSFSWAVVGPLTMKYFADYGATVIRVETGKRPCTTRTSAPYVEGETGSRVNKSGAFGYYSANMLSMALDLSQPLGLDVARKLIAQADIVMENFTPGVMERWGLGYAELKKIKPDIIMLRQSGFGQKGPYSRLPAFGMILGPIAGLPNFIGWPDREPLPVGVGAYTDYISPRFAVATAIAALDYRNRTGKGQLLEISQFETAVYFGLPGVLDYQANGREPSRVGNSSSHAVPHGVYRCKGEDRWCTISVFNDEQWRQLCNVMGKPEYVDNPQFSTFQKRKEHEDQVNSFVGEWTSLLRPEEIMSELQAVGVAAGVVKNAADMYVDPQLRQRNFYWPMDHAEMGHFTHLGTNFALSKTPAEGNTPSPCLGEHSEYVCTKILKMSDEEFVELIAANVLQ